MRRYVLPFLLLLLLLGTVGDGRAASDSPQLLGPGEERIVVVPFVGATPDEVAGQFNHLRIGQPIPWWGDWILQEVVTVTVAYDPASGRYSLLALCRVWAIVP